MGVDSISSFVRHSPDPECCRTDGKWMVFAHWEGIVLFTPPLCDLNTYLVYFTPWACTCSCWPEAMAVSGRVKIEKEPSNTHSSMSPQNLPLRGSLSGPCTGHIALSRRYFPFLRFCKCFEWSRSKEFVLPFDEGGIVRSNPWHSVQVINTHDEQWSWLWRPWGWL